MNTHKGAKSVPKDQMAEGVGFEPTVGCPTPVFKTGAIDHSATPPEALLKCGRCLARIMRNGKVKKLVRDPERGKVWGWRRCRNRE
jgi:hypothetical protein